MMTQEKEKYFTKDRGIRFVKFALIGTIGWGLNELLIFLCLLALDQFFVNDLLFELWFLDIKKLQIASIVSIILVAAFNFTINKIWTFKKLEENVETKPAMQFGQFLLIGLSAAVLYVGLIYLLHNLLHWNEYLASTIGFYVGLINNFIWNDLWTFNPENKKQKEDNSKEQSENSNLSSLGDG